MTDRVSAADLPTGKRISAARLTPTERETLEKEGRISPDGFVDIAPPAAPQMIDIRAEARKSAAAALKSVGDVQPVPGGTEASRRPSYEKELHDEIARLNTELDARKSCPRCGLNLKEKYEIEPTAEDIEEFLKCVISGSVYTKEYVVFGGKLKVKLRTRTGTEENLIKKAITAYFKESNGVSEGEVLSELLGYSLAVSLCAYGGQEYPSLPLTNGATFREAAQERINTLPSQIQALLKTLLEQFNVLSDKLTSRAQDPSFWTGTAV